MDSSTSTPAVSWRPQTFFSHAIASVPQIDRLNAEGGIAVDFRPAGGAAPALAFEGGQSPSLSLWRTTSRSGFLTIPKLDADVVTIRFVTAGSMVRRDQGAEYIGQPGRAMMVMFEAMRNEEASSGFAAVSGTVTRTALASAHIALEGGDSPGPLPRFRPVVDATGQPLQNLMVTMDTVFQQLKAGVQSADLVFPLLEEVMIYRLLVYWPREFPDVVQPVGVAGQRPLKRAKDYIDGHIAGKLLLADVAAAAGVGVRRLQMAFRTETGKTPAQYILDRRLDRVRLDLRTPAEQETPIGTIAARWGSPTWASSASVTAPASANSRARRDEPSAIAHELKRRRGLLGRRCRRRHPAAFDLVRPAPHARYGRGRDQRPGRAVLGVAAHGLSHPRSAAEWRSGSRIGAGSHCSSLGLAAGPSDL